MSETDQLNETRKHVDRCAHALRSISKELELLVRTAVDRNVDLGSLHRALESVCTTLELITSTCADLRATIERFPVRELG